MTQTRLDSGEFSEHSVYQTFFAEISAIAKVPIHELAEEHLDDEDLEADGGEAEGKGGSLAGSHSSKSR